VNAPQYYVIRALRVLYVPIHGNTTMQIRGSSRKGTKKNTYVIITYEEQKYLLRELARGLISRLLKLSSPTHIAETLYSYLQKWHVLAVGCGIFTQQPIKCLLPRGAILYQVACSLCINDIPAQNSTRLFRAVCALNLPVYFRCTPRRREDRRETVASTRLVLAIEH
jgi:hypothetical protein